MNYLKTTKIGYIELYYVKVILSFLFPPWVFVVIPDLFWDV